MTAAAFEAIVEDFEFLESWEDRYRYVIDLGKALNMLPETARTDDIKVHGCASQVWLQSTTKDGIFQFDGASDAIIVSGLIAVLHALWNGEPIEAVAQSDAKAELARLDLTDHLSAQRSNGLSSMIERLQSDARAALGEETTH